MRIHQIIDPKLSVLKNAVSLDIEAAASRDILCLLISMYFVVEHVHESIENSPLHIVHIITEFSFPFLSIINRFFSFFH